MTARKPATPEATKFRRAVTAYRKAAQAYLDNHQDSLANHKDFMLVVRARDRVLYGPNHYGWGVEFEAQFASHFASVRADFASLEDRRSALFQAWNSAEREQLRQAKAKRDREIYGWRDTPSSHY